MTTTCEDLLVFVLCWQVPDPYRWLEDADSTETKAFVDAQNNLTMPYIHSCPHRSKLHDTLKGMMDFPKISCPFKRGDRYFYFYNTGLQNQRYTCALPCVTLRISKALVAAVC